MRLPVRLSTAAILGLLLFPRAATAQHVTAAHDWPRLQLAVGQSIADAVPRTVALAEPFGRGPAQSPQRVRYGNPTPYVIGGSAIGAFAGGVIGYAGCVAGDGDCSMLIRLAAGTGIGAFLGAVFWLASAVER